MTESNDPFGGFDINALMQQAAAVQEQLVAAQEELAEAHVDGTAGGVTVTVTGTGELTRVQVTPGSFDAADAESLTDLGDLVVAAYRDAKASADALAAEKLGPLAGGLGGLGGPGDAGPGGLRVGSPVAVVRWASRRAAAVYEGALQDLIDELGRLPGVGPKSAQRLAFHLLASDPVDVRRLADALMELKAKARFCEICGNVAEEEQCRICRDPRRDDTSICVVEEPKDVVAIERTREFRGRYHVLGGAISPLDGIGPEQLRVRELIARLHDGTVQEIILAMDPNIEGDATAAYLNRMLSSMDLTVTRLASGLPVGGDLEYADEVTLGRAFAGRRAANA